MNVDIGVDEFGREHFIVEAPRGRLGISLGENERGFVVIRGLDALSASDMEAWDEIDRRRVQLMRLSVQVGDRIVAIEGQEVTHCCLQEIINRLNKLAPTKRRLTLARYHETAFKIGKFDAEKLVLARVPSGPLGLQINECIPYCAVVEDFQRLADGSMTKLASHPKIHRGCQIVNVNGRDVSSSSREDVVALLGSLKDQEKEVVFYRATGSGCSSIFSVDSSASERHLGFTIDENDSMRCVITSVGPRGDPRIGLGDVLIGVNLTDITTMPRKEAIALVKDTPLPRQLYFARLVDDDLPECHAVKIGPGPLGVNLDGERRDCARITGFTTPQDAERPEFKNCSRFVAGSYVLSIGSLVVVDHELTAISSLLSKLKQAPKTILIGNKALRDIYRMESIHARVAVPKGPLGINFNGGEAESAAVSGFYVSPVDGTQGVIQSSGLVPVGAVLQRINEMNVSCLPLPHIIGLLKKLSDVPKELIFHRGDSEQDVNTRVIDVRLPAGPLGIDLKRSIANKVIVDKLNSDPARGSTRVFDHGGVIEGSEIVALDGFDVSKLELAEVLELLKLLSNHEKVITFSTTRAAYESMLDSAKNPCVVRVEVPGNLSLPLNTGILDQAVLTSNLQLVPLGSRLVGIEFVDVRCLSLQQVLATLGCLQSAVQVSLHFDTTGAGRVPSPSKPWLAEAVSSVLTDKSTSPSNGATTDKLRGSISHRNLQVDVAPSLAATRPSVSWSDLNAASDASHRSAPSSPTRHSAAMSAGLSPKPIVSPSSSREASSTVTPPPPPSTQSSTARAPSLGASSSLARLSIRTMEATPAGAEAAKLENDKQQSQTTNSSKTEYLINMASWTGSRSLFRLVLDAGTSTLEISPVKAASPRPGKSSGFTLIHLNEISALDCGSGGAVPGQRPALFRSSSATLNADGTERATVILTTAGRKTVEFDMRSTSDRLAFAARLQSLVPALQPPPAVPSTSG